MIPKSRQLYRVILSQLRKGTHGFCLDYTIENEAPSPSATFKGSGYIRATLEPDDYHAFVYDPLLKSDAAQEMRGSQWNLG
ncbi:hypothetical protein Purlil1_6788 [Purpureocillium lilacinum]|uniref:Uncharacterized protein n=1 Tax=Purpureocillium lilacinum TaxID=33203 RepID=A0ABR0BY92_PURLI|nr:hypothetical protein Purlil1_6788 [Purpureocillium lilacinum]